ncbi:MAG TPA: helix-turn-helix transcriptional regulator [Longimicrobiales bacterium]|nr:helix-turn-helix transcriptional regulator [Longimicrobiales bacterium]
MDENRDSRLPLLLVVALASIVVGGTVDLVLDRPERWLSFHVIFESLMIAGALLMATTLWLGWWRAERSLGEMRARLEARKAERDEWRENAQKALQGLGLAIHKQFDAWGLTPAEREVALLLLKGYSHKHVASATGRSERTARQHAAAVYQKAGLGSRAELAAYFLEDLLLPEGERAGSGAT